MPSARSKGRHDLTFKGDRLGPLTKARGKLESPAQNGRTAQHRRLHAGAFSVSKIVQRAAATRPPESGRLGRRIGQMRDH